MKEILGSFSGWLGEKAIAFLIWAVVLGVGVPLAAPYINKYLITEIAKELEKQRNAAKTRADEGFRRLGIIE
ncbi:MAG: hypothetical protein OXB84_07680 [Halobacteriovoraceae bacterium]|nr:hypothetical protein [Halobacteriovoraceae bacterium]